MHIIIIACSPIFKFSQVLFLYAELPCIRNNKKNLISKYENNLLYGIHPRSKNYDGLGRTLILKISREALVRLISLGRPMERHGNTL